MVVLMIIVRSLNMTTNEFIKAVENLGYEAEKDEGCITITYKNKILADVFINELYRMSSYFSKIDCVENVGVLFALIFQYAVTPIEDREKEEKFLIQHKYLVSKSFYPVCMVWHKSKDVYRVINCKVDNLVYQVQFTLNEIEEIKQKLNTDLADFELVEVKE